MKIIIILILCLINNLIFCTPIKDSVSSFTFQRLAMLKNFDCDACGCSVNGGSMGFSSMLNNDFVGLRYFKQKYTSRNGIYANSPMVNESFNTLQIWSRIPITKKLQISALVPYHFNEREQTTGIENISGLGDISLVALYTVFQTQKDSTLFMHKIELGGGVKMPTGKFKEANNLGNVNQSFQLGTGSWDYLMVAEYIVKCTKWGLNSMLNYILKTENEKKYQYGNQFNYSGTLFYMLDANIVKIVPQLGFAGEVYATNKQYGLTIHNTAGDILFSKFGVELGKNNFSLGINTMLPITQNLANGNIKANYRWSLNLNYTL